MEDSPFPLQNLKPKWEPFPDGTPTKKGPSLPKPIFHDEDKIRRQQDSERFKNYLNKTGIAIAFITIYSEILFKDIPEEHAYNYTVMRLRQIGNSIMQIDKKKLYK